MRFVLDTNVAISAFLWNGSPRRLLEAEYRKDISLFTSAPMIDELRDVLERPKFRPQLASSPFTADELIERFALLATAVSPEYLPRTAPDPDDDVVIATALAARADAIVTGDRGLLSVGSYAGGRILSVADALKMVFPG